MNFLKENKFLIAYSVLYLALFLLFYPSFISSSDEHGYLKSAQLLTEGKLAGEDIFSSARSFVNNNLFYPVMFIGYSFFLFLFVLFGFDKIFLLGLLILLFGLYLFSKFFKLFNINQKYLFFYLFFPPFVWISRTIYPHLLAGLFLFLGFYFYIKYVKKSEYLDLFLAGFFIGVGVFIRADLVLPLILFGLTVFYKYKEKILFFVLGGTPLLLLFLFLNNLMYGSFFNSGYNVSGISYLLGPVFGIHLFDFFIYLVVFSLVYPFMITSPFFLRKKLPWLEIYALVFGGLLLQSTYANIFFAGFNPLSFIFINVRYFIPILPILVFCFIFMFNEFMNKNEKYSFLVPFLFLFLFCTTIGFSYKHSDFLDSRFSVFQTIQEKIPDGSLVLGSSDDHIYFSPIFSSLKYLRIDYCNDFNPCPDFDFSQVFSQDFYVLDLEYGNREGRDSPRQLETINKERQVVKDFIIANSENLELIYESSFPNSFKIYKYSRE